MPPLTAHDFIGTWKIKREIHDHLAATHVTFDGQTKIAPSCPSSPRAALYAEEGRLILTGGQSLMASRRYLWLLGDEGIDVCFEDGRPFHRIHLGGPQAQPAQASDLHHCAEDLYTARYDFAQWPQWRCQWCVQGPKKDYVMTSDYAPL